MTYDVPSLIPLAARFLRRMQLGDGLFCNERVRGDSDPRGRSLRYSLMTYIGLAKADAAGVEHRFDLDAIRSALWAELGSRELRPGDLGLYLWADAVRGSTLDSGGLVAAAERAFDDTGGVGTREGQEAAWIVIGLARHETARETPAGSALLRTAFGDLLRRAEQSTGLLYHYGVPHRRRRFANFASQSYGLLALSAVAREALDERALPAARALGDRLLGLQLDDGGWPWLFDVERGTVVEPYEVYSVHQHAMAPMALLELAEVSRDERYREAAVKGLEWIHGRNELGLEMVDEESELIYRSIRRKRPSDRIALYTRTLSSLVRKRNQSLGGRIELNATCRPYELGWLLEAWCGRA